MGTIPLLLIFPDHSFFDILFISSSLSTTTGSWFFYNVVVPSEAIIWQSALQWLGGLLTLVIACSFVEALFDKSSSERTFFDLSKSSAANVARYTNKPLLSGYISEEKLMEIKNTASILAKRQGSGRVVLFADNPSFRAFWYGTNGLLLNAVFFGRSF